jgi:hypothetical protein
MVHRVNIAQVADRLTEPFKHLVVGQVANYCAYLTHIEGSYLFHQHAEDEMYLVLEGEIGVDTPTAPVSPLTRGRAWPCERGKGTAPGQSGRRWYWCSRPEICLRSKSLGQGGKEK